MSESRHIQVKVLAPLESDVRHKAGLFSDYRRNPVETLSYFRRARRVPQLPWSMQDLRDFCATRPLSHVGKNKKPLQTEDLLDRIERQLEAEVEHTHNTLHIHNTHSLTHSHTGG